MEAPLGICGKPGDSRGKRFQPVNPNRSVKLVFSLARMPYCGHIHLMASPDKLLAE
jgi:hypothetical protein